MEITRELKRTLREQGFIPLRDNINFAVRIIVPCGILTTETSNKITELAEKYGRGKFYLTQRLGIEIPFIKYENLEIVKKELADVGLDIGGTGKKVRAILTCKGSICRSGLYDSEALTEHFNKKFYIGYHYTELPNKFKIVVGGCKNNCSRPTVADVGLTGVELGRVEIRIGGLSGKSQIFGKLLPKTYSLSEAEEVIEKCLNYYIENGISGERFGNTIERIGCEHILEHICN